MRKAFIENGIGETRAIVVADGAIVEAHIERAPDIGGGWRAGDVREARLTKILVSGVRGIVMADDDEALLSPVPTTLTEGISFRVRVVREALMETGRPRLAKVVATTGAVCAGPALVERLRARGIPVAPLPSAGYFEELGWSEVVETAKSGVVTFPGGALTISPTPAMTVIDVDGDLAPVALALAAADMAAAAIMRFDLTGSIGIDFPTVADKAARSAIGARLDAALPQPFERTAVNGFGFAQIVRPRLRASLIETLRADRVATAALTLLRAAERDGIGRATLIASPMIVEWFGAHRRLIDELARRRGGDIGLRADPSLPMSSCYVAPVA
jgi:Ribonuclease G/E